MSKFLPCPSLENTAGSTESFLCLPARATRVPEPHYQGGTPGPGASVLSVPSSWVKVGVESGAVGSLLSSETVNCQAYVFLMDQNISNHSMWEPTKHPKNVTPSFLPLPKPANGVGVQRGFRRTRRTLKPLCCGGGVACVLRTLAGLWLVRQARSDKEFLPWVTSEPHGELSKTRYPGPPHTS